MYGYVVKTKTKKQLGWKPCPHFLAPVVGAKNLSLQHTLLSLLPPTFELEMCFAQQRHSLFRHLIFQEWSETIIFLHFRVGNVLRATAACTFSTSHLPKGVRRWCALYILTWNCASRHNSVHFFDISSSKSGLRPSVFYTFELEMCFAPQRHSLFRHLNFQNWSEHGVLCKFWLGHVLRIDISTSKNGPTLVCFVYFYLELCFASQQRALFRHLIFQEWSETISFLHFRVGNVLRAATACTFSTSQPQKWSDVGVLCTFWLGTVLRVTTACTFSTSHLPSMVWDHQFFTLLSWKCASHHNGAHFFDISTCKSGPSMVCFVNLTWKRASRNFSSLIWPAGSASAALASQLLEPPEPQIIWKTQWIATFLPFRAPASSFFSPFFSSLIFLLLFFSSLTVPTSAFPSVHIVGSLTSKLPSINWIYKNAHTHTLTHTHVYIYIYMYIRIL